MSIKAIIPNIEDNKNSQKINANTSIPQALTVRSSNTLHEMPKDSVSFTGAGFNPIVSTMDFIEAGGYAASFIIQDGLGFIAPRVGKGLLRGSKKTDENGQPVLNENGKQKREYNWQLARKEFIREIITGPSAFLIPMAMFAGIKKWGGSANNVKLNYIEGFSQPFIEFAKQNAQAIKDGSKLNKGEFYRNVFNEAIEQSINNHLPKGEKLSKERISELAQQFADRQLQVEEIVQDKQYKGFFHRKARAAKLKEIGGTVEDLFMELKKSTIGGSVNEMAVEFRTSKGIRGGSISDLIGSLNDYFDDAVKTTKKAIKENLSAEYIENTVKHFTNRRMGSRILTNLGIFGTVAMFYTQIPKLYKMGINGNPALKGTAAEQEKNKKQIAKTGSEVKRDSTSDVSFTGMGSLLEKAGEKTFSHTKLKSVSDIFEFNGNVMSGAAMPVLLYGFCIPPRLKKADDKYDYGEIVLRDMTSFTALLFGAKALARLFSDGVTKLTGLALNKKDLENRNVFQRVIDYLNPLDKRHSVLSSKQLESKYMNIDKYKGGVNGFIQFIEESGGDIKKAFAKDDGITKSIEDIIKKFGTGKSYSDSTSSEIKNALRAANKAEDQTLINKFYDLFKSENGLLKKAKTLNSAFGFVSTIILIPLFIIWLAHQCEKMTERRAKQDMEAAETEKSQKAAEHLERRKTQFASHKPTMAGFLGNNAA